MGVWGFLEHTTKSREGASRAPPAIQIWQGKTTSKSTTLFFPSTIPIDHLDCRGERHH